MASNLSLFAFALVGLIAVAGISFSEVAAPDATGMSVSIAADYPRDVPHVLVSTRPDRCVGDAYCAAGQVCVQGRCLVRRSAEAKGIVSKSRPTTEPSPNYASYPEPAQVSSAPESVSYPISYESPYKGYVGK